MIGSMGDRMLQITMPHVNSWNAWYNWFGNQPQGLEPLRSKVDAACREVGRDPHTVERTVAILVRLPGGQGRVAGNEEEKVEPLQGDPEVIAQALRSYARAGVAHVQLIIDPITERSIAALRPVLEKLDADQ